MGRRLRELVERELMVSSDWKGKETLKKPSEKEKGCFWGDRTPPDTLVLGCKFRK